MSTYKALYLSPMIPSYNLEETGKFFKDILSFTPHMETETYAIYHKDNLTVHLLRAGKDIGQMEFYLEVDDLDSLWNTIKDKLQGLKIREPFNQAYGMREVHISILKPTRYCLSGRSLKRSNNVTDEPGYFFTSTASSKMKFTCSMSEALSLSLPFTVIRSSTWNFPGSTLNVTSAMDSGPPPPQKKHWLMGYLERII